MKKLIDLYPYRIEENGVSFLLLKRSADKIYSGQWRMIGGKVRKGETRWETALRELYEETGLTPELFWTVPTLNHFYEASEDQIHLIPAFAAQIRPDSEVILDEEHKTSKWIASGEIKNCIFWPEQKRIIECISTIVQTNRILKDWIIKLDHT